MYIRLHKVNMARQGRAEVCYNLNTHELVYLSEPKVKLGKRFGMDSTDTIFTYKTEKGYLLCANAENIGFQTHLGTTHTGVYTDRPLDQLIVDILIKIIKSGVCPYTLLRSRWASYKRAIAEVTGGEVTLPMFKHLTEYLPLLPEDQILTREGLLQYRSVVGTYCLVDKIFTCYTIEEQKTTPTRCLYKELEATIQLKGEVIVFSNGEKLPIYRVLEYASPSKQPELSTLRTAYTLANEHSDYTKYRVEELQMGDVATIAGDITYVHENAFIRIQYMGKQTYYETDANSTGKRLEGSRCKLIDSQDNTSSCGSFGELINACQIADFYENLCGVDTLRYIGISHIEVTKKGYDIRVLVCRDNVKICAYYELPLLVCGKPCIRVGEGYLYKLGLHEVILSKTMYENLICVGNGTQIYQP